MNLQRVEQQFHSRLKCNRGLQRRSLSKAKRLKVIAFLLDRKRYNFRPFCVYFLVWAMRKFLVENRIDVQKCITAVMVAMLIASKMVPKNCT